MGKESLGVGTVIGFVKVNKNEGRVRRPCQNVFTVTDYILIFLLYYGSYCLNISSFILNERRGWV